MATMALLLFLDETIVFKTKEIGYCASILHHSTVCFQTLSSEKKKDILKVQWEDLICYFGPFFAITDKALTSLLEGHHLGLFFTYFWSFSEIWHT